MYTVHVEHNDKKWGNLSASATVRIPRDEPPQIDVMGGERIIYNISVPHRSRWVNPLTRSELNEIQDILEKAILNEFMELIEDDVLTVAYCRQN